MTEPHEPPRANKTDAGNGSKAICRVSNVLRSPSPDPKRSAKMKPPLLPWPFDQAPNVAAVTSTHITMQRMPILLVTHYEDDDSWGFQSGHPVTTADAQVVAMKTIVEIDPSVTEIASLAPGYSAVRESVGGEWKITKDEWTHDEQ